MKDRTSTPAGPVTVTWLALLALSLGSFVLAEPAGGGASTLVLGLVLVKLLLVVAVFLELAHRGRAWLLPIGGFLVLVVAVLAGILDG